MEHSLQRVNAEQRAQLWVERIRECRSSGKSVRAWCREREISEKTYYYWQKRIYQQMISTAETGRFVEIPWREEPAPRGSAAAKVRLTGAEVEIYAGADTQMIQTILRELRRC